MRSGSAQRCRSRGVTFVGLLAALAVMSAGLAAVGVMWSTDANRQREAELLRVGALYARAIASYRAASPGNQADYPPDLQALVRDHRFPGTRRHLRRLYADPLSPQRPWGLVQAQDGGIRGVFSLSEDVPLRTAPVDLGITLLQSARHYKEWQFVPNVKP